MPTSDQEYSSKFPPVAGLNLKEVKAILKFQSRHFSFSGSIDIGAPMQVLGCRAVEADRYLRAMAQQGYLVHDSSLPVERERQEVEPHPSGIAGLGDFLHKIHTPATEWETQKGHSCWYLTPLAMQLRMEKLLKRMTRGQAEKLLAELLNIVRTINAEEDNLLCVTRVDLFGSILDAKRKSYGDIDLFIKQEPRPMAAQRQDELVKKLSNEARRTEGYFIRYYDDLEAAQARVHHLNIMRLRKPGRRISITSQHPAEIGTNYRTIYAFDRTRGREADASNDIIAPQEDNPTRAHETSQPAYNLPSFQTVAYPKIASLSEHSEPLYRNHIHTDNVIPMTADLMAVQPSSRALCSECQSYWCEHNAPLEAAPIQKDSFENYLVELERDLERHPLGDPIAEIKSSSAHFEALMLKTSYPRPLGIPLIRSKYLTIAKPGLSLSSGLEDTPRFFSWNDFPVRSGRLDTHFSTDCFETPDDFIHYMRLQHALIALWKAAKMIGGGESFVKVDLTKINESFPLKDLASLGRLNRAYQKCAKSLIDNHPYPEINAKAHQIAVTETGVYSPGRFSVEVSIDPDNTEIRIICHSLTLLEDLETRSELRLGSGKGQDPETEKHRQNLTTELQDIVKALRSLPGFVCAGIYGARDLDYPEI